MRAGRRPWMTENVAAAPATFFDHLWARLFSRCSRKSVRGSHRLLAAFLRTGDHFGCTGWIFLPKTKKEGSPFAPCKGAFFLTLSKSRGRYFCKSNKTPPLVSARNHKKCSDFEGGVGNEARIAIALALTASAVGRPTGDNSWRSPFCIEFMALGWI